jgi:2-C-methyl-D-erythritol 4-phosphate cytidylyltransferase
MPRVVAIIPSAGMGLRMGGKIYKQFLTLRDAPVLVHTLRKFHQSRTVEDIIIPVPNGYVEKVQQKIIEPYNFLCVSSVIPGGKSRQESVWIGLQSMPPGVEVVVVHDGVRPFISPEIIDQTVELCKDYPGVVVGYPVTDSVKMERNSLVEKTLPREHVWVVQTPQTFRAEVIQDAYKYAFSSGYFATDDSSIVGHRGYKIFLLEGDPSNIKITTPDDLALAEYYLGGS